MWQNKTKDDRKNLILIGMPGAGKSTVGVVLAKKLGYRFVDSDLVIQERTGKLLHELIEELGISGFWQQEEAVNCSLEGERMVIATGGSAVYGTKAMEHFKQMGTVVYLQLGLEELESRLGDLNERGVTLKPGQTLQGLLEERTPYYEKYADLTVSCEKKSIREIVEEIVDEQRKN